MIDIVEIDEATSDEEEEGEMEVVSVLAGPFHVRPWVSFSKYFTDSLLLLWLVPWRLSERNVLRRPIPKQRCHRGTPKTGKQAQEPE